MASTVYSRHLLAANVQSAATAGAAVYTVPAGKVVVVRSVDMFVDAVGTVLCGRNAGTLFIPFVSSSTIGQFSCKQWEGYQVFTAGNAIACQWLSGSVRVLVAGFMLNEV